ncbi:hypothetical protein [Gilvimarinus xylanilyticus]|uniref:DUF1735 domain-containing protein n=1 Tax=Gilvimarinus xylanilyticus TaxID=2944139 RepID=A0A9X2I1Z1_9GAMM|nr:hypothetical protein [Gilvimarinus xylanilyticus]MCP8898671.1 hypothetical protein [Gilvimarinus xylanilyticus]
MNKSKSITMAIFWLPWAVQACDLDFNLEPSPINVSYEPFSAVGALGKTTFELRNTAQEDKFILDLRAIEAPTLDEYQILFEANTSDAQLRPIDDQRFELQLAPGESKKIDLNALVSHASVPPAGVTEITFELSATSANTGIDCWEQLYLPVHINAPSRAQFNIAGADTAYFDGPNLYHLDFGKLVSGMNRRVFFQLRANDKVTMTLESENNGRMVHQTQSKYGVAYTFSLEGQELDLSSKTTIHLETAPTFRGISMPVDITIGSTNGIPSGDYADTITIDVSAL